MSDNLIPEDHGHVPEKPKEHLESKLCPEANFSGDYEIENNSDSNSDTEASLRRKKRVKCFSDSDSESRNQKSGIDDDNGLSSQDLKPQTEPHSSEATSDSEAAVSKTQVPKSRIRKVYSDSSSDFDDNKSVAHDDVTLEHSQRSRIKDKRDKLHQKFKSLLTSKRKSVEVEHNDSREEKGDEQNDRNSDASDDEASSIEKLKQKIKERTQHLKTTIYDPDTSDEESGENKIKQSQKRLYKKSAKPRKPSPKPAKMSAKQAIENMQKIKSESNRMLREKEVSLPYHRPKALSLKDIMSRRRPAVSADGKALPIKMNEDQLKQYALMLEERQKEMMELCKSDTEEDELKENEGNNENNDELSSANDKSFDTLIEKPDDPKSEINYPETINDELEIKKSITKENASSINNQDDGALDKKTENTTTEFKSKDEPISTGSNNVNESITDEKTTNESKNNKDNEILDGNASTETELAYNDSVDDENPPDMSSKLLRNLSESITDENTTNKSKNNEDNDILDDNASAEMELVYNDSVDDDNPADKSSNLLQSISTEACTENDSQLISLHLDTEKTEKGIEVTETNIAEDHNPTISGENYNSNVEEVSEIEGSNQFSDNDDDINLEDIDFLIENAEIISSQPAGSVNSPMLVKDTQSLKINPKLMGAPGMVIDLDGTDACAPKKSGVELLKERFTYFAKLKTPEELEREKEKKIKPGTQHLKLKHELEEIIAEQRSLEWAKRLEEERKQKMEIEAVIGDADGDCEDDIDKIEAKLEENENIQEESSSSDEEESEVEDDCEIKEKPRKNNPLIDEEAEVSDDDSGDVIAQSDDEGNKGDDEGEDLENDDGDGIDEEDTEEESSEDDNEEQFKPKKGRILKAFEDSDDEEAAKAKEETKVTVDVAVTTSKTVCDLESEKESTPIKNTEDDEIQLAQKHKSFSEDLFTSQESVHLDKFLKENVSHGVSAEDRTLVSQSFSIAKISNTQWCNTEPSDKQNDDEGNLDDVVGMCTGGFSQNLVASQIQTQREHSSQDIGDDILALCTGKFYDNQFVSQLDSGVTQINDNTVTEKFQNNDSPIKEGVKSNFENQKHDDKENKEDSRAANNIKEINKHKSDENDREHIAEDNKLLSSILDELNDAKFETKKPLKYFVGNETQNKENRAAVANSQPSKKRLIINSDDEANDKDTLINNKNKKLKKKKLQDRALQISDDEEELEEYDEDEYESDIEDEAERIVEYDSEENEVVVQADNPKKKKKVSEFFEQEAELTSEDEWVGSGDEDEAGLDRMEREAGDEDAFHQGRLRRQLEQIHMRDVLDQDKREVRLIQELLLEDGDLGGGHRQRKFRWKNVGGEDEDTTYAELLDTQEEEFESEEQWRKQRHERETFLRQMKQQEEPEESIDICKSRTSLIKATLNSKTVNYSILDASDYSIADKSATTLNTSGVAEKKCSTDIPSPKKPFTLFKKNYHGSLLTRGQGALARLAALALPLAAADDEQPAARATHSGRNFVFAALSQDDEPPKVTKRKADANVGTPRLVKKMRTADNKKNTKNSLLDHLNT